MPQASRYDDLRFRVGMLMMVPLAGCSSLTGLSVPTANDPQTAAKAAMETYDTDGDGKIAGVELDKCHSLKSVIDRIDTSRDDAISVDEIVQRLEAYRSQSTFVGVVIHVSKGGSPLEGAVITMTPEPFLGDGFQVFEGKSDSSGAVMVAGRQSDTPGVPTGLYTVVVSHPASDTEQTVGCEVSDDTGNRLDFSF